MRKTIGKVVIIDTNPPYRPWDGNQATYLFFPIFIAFVLTLLSGLSEPIIGGLNVVKVNTGINGTVTFGAWGWCSQNVPEFNNTCSGNKAFGGSMHAEINDLPGPVRSLTVVADALPGPYLIANSVFHVLGALTMWLTVTWTLAAAGSWHKQEQQAWEWTRCAFHGTGVSALFVLIAWGLDLGMVTKVASQAINADGSQPKVTPGPAVWMMMTAFLLNFVTYIVRLVYLRRQPRPLWSVKGAGGDFHSNPMPPVLPLSAALPPSDDHPPTWESLNLNDAEPLPEKVGVELTEKESLALEEVLMERERSRGNRHGSGYVV